MTSVLYRDVADDLRRTVATLQPGATLRSEHDLVKEYRVSRQTIRSALTTLANEGLITSVRGRGWAVRHRQPLVWVASDPERNTTTDVSPADVWSNGIRAQGRDPRQEIRVETIAAAGTIAALLDLPEGEHVTVRRRLRWVDRMLMSTADTYYPRSIVAGTAIELPADVLPGTYAVMEAIGHGWHDYRDRLVPRPPTADEAEMFAAGPGVAVLEHTRVRRDADGRVVAVTITVLPGDRNEIIYEGGS